MQQSAYRAKYYGVWENGGEKYRTHFAGYGMFQAIAGEAVTVEKAGKTFALASGCL